jgi:hypothetical protein
MQIEPFKVEIWMNEWETQCTYNLAETCVASITVEELLALSGGSADDLSRSIADEAHLWRYRGLTKITNGHC